jgi:hypothetical protein
MKPTSPRGRDRRWRRLSSSVATGIGLAAVAYATYVGVTWYRYGKGTAPRDAERDPLLDRFMPAYEIAERHHIRVAAPATVTLAAAGELDLQASPIVRTIIRAREVVLGATASQPPHPRGLLAEVTALGWGVLASVPGREVVVGAVTKPWEPDVTFRAISPEEFAGFREPGYVKIAWTIRADEVNAAESIFRTETRAIATDDEARKKFRRYWSIFSPGIILIRWAVLTPVKRAAERRADRRHWIGSGQPDVGGYGRG